MSTTYRRVRNVLRAHSSLSAALVIAQRPELPWPTGYMYRMERSACFFYRRAVL